MIIDHDGLRIGLDDTGSGPPVLLLHGWPDSRELWRHQVPALAAAGYRVVAPDLRGFGESGKPTDVAAYAMNRMAGDVVGVLDALGIDSVHLVGHDWGAAIAWYTATFMPDRVSSLTALSVGHPASVRAAGLQQREKSWYMLLFQFTGIAEEWLGADDFRRFREWSGHPDADAVAKRLSEPAALTASLGVYRANVPPATLLGPPLELPPVAAPTMGVWSTGDMALLENGMTGSAAHVAGPWRYERIDGAGHWMQLDAPDAVNALLLDFLSGL
jgi:pimeloyl-ACP methyl ester carboxylesterase